jgi:hypothetical protein
MKVVRICAAKVSKSDDGTSVHPPSSLHGVALECDANIDACRGREFAGTTTRGTPREAPTRRSRWRRRHAVTQRRSRIAKEESSGRFPVNLAREWKLVFETDIRRRQASNQTVRYTPVGIWSDGSRTAAFVQLSRMARKALRSMAICLETRHKSYDRIPPAISSESVQRTRMPTCIKATGQM